VKTAKYSLVGYYFINGGIGKRLRVIMLIVDLKMINEVTDLFSV
jgi:hypothetical protein